jgi:hypothetical protein
MLCGPIGMVVLPERFGQIKNGVDKIKKPVFGKDIFVVKVFENDSQFGVKIVVVSQGCEPVACKKLLDLCQIRCGGDFYKGLFNHGINDVVGLIKPKKLIRGVLKKRIVQQYVVKIIDPRFVINGIVELQDGRFIF